MSAHAKPGPAEADLLAAAAREPDQPGPQVRLARHELAHGRPAAAQRRLLELEARFPGDAETKLALCAAMLAQRDLDAGARWLEAARSAGAPSDRLARLEAQLAGARGDLATQEDLLKQLVTLTGATDVQLQVQLCRCLIAQNELERAGALVEALKAGETAGELVRGLELELDWARGRHDEVLDVLARWAETDGAKTPGVHLNLVAKTAERHGPAQAAARVVQARAAGIAESELAPKAAHYGVSEDWVGPALVEAIEAGRPVYWKNVMQLAGVAGECVLPPILEALEHSPLALHRDTARSVRALFEALPKRDEAQGALVAEDRSRDFMLVRPEAASRGLCILFAGGEDTFSLPAPFIDRFLAERGLAAIYLRDFQRAFFELGVAGLAAGYAGTVEALRGQIRDLGAQNVYTFGVSAGGFAAVRYGIDLGAEAVLGLGIQSWISREGVAAARDPRVPSLVEAFWARVPDDTLDLAVQIKRAENAPRIDLHYGEGMPYDRFYARHMEGLPGVRVFEKAGLSSHAITMHLIRNGEFGAALDAWLTGAPFKSPSSGMGTKPVER